MAQALVHLNIYTITLIDDSPLIYVLYPSNNTLQCTQINNLIKTKILVVIDAIPQCCFDFSN